MSLTKLFKRSRSQIACSARPELKYSCIIVGFTQQTAAIALHIAMCDTRTLVIELGASSDSLRAQREQCELAGVHFQAATSINIRARDCAAVVVNGAATDLMIAPIAVVPATTLAAARAHGSASRVLEGEGMCIISTGTTWLRSEMLLMKMLSATALLATRSEQCCPASLILRSESCTSVVSTDSSRSSSSSPSSSIRRKSWFWQAPPVYTL
eukprot:13582-Heterococcus_DN1.PRE.2